MEDRNRRIGRADKPIPETHASPPNCGNDDSSGVMTPPYLKAAEVASLLRTSRKAIYSMIERGQLPGVVRIGRRVLIRRDDVVLWLDQKRAPSPKE